MSDTVDVGDLIKRLESASEGSRELDAWVGHMVGWTCSFADEGKNPNFDPSTWPPHQLVTVTWTRPDRSADVDTWYREPVGDCHPNDRFLPPDAMPHYTASLDAALTLVPEGWEMSLLRTKALAYTRGTKCAADLWNTGEYGRHQGMGPEVTGSSDTLALALCIAALKAREQSK